MDCTQASNLISAWIDGELDAADRVGLEAHLATCDSCRAASDAARNQDGTLLRAFQPLREASSRIADSVLDAWSDEIAVRPTPRQIPVMTWISTPLAATAGFLLAVILFQPWNDDTPVTPIGTPVATLVVSTGDVDVRQHESSDWHTVPRSFQFLCSQDSVVRTADDVQCELTTSEGCVVRLNGGSEVYLPSSRRVELLRGQIWCSSPDDAALRVLVQDTSPSDKPGLPRTNVTSTTPLTVDCSANSSLVTAIQDGGDVQVTSARGDILVGTSQARQRLSQGETAKIVKGQIIKDASLIDPILACSWIQPLLIRKGHSDTELAGRIDQLLAQLGRSKMSTLYEQEIRSLGEFCVLPLLRYVQSPISAEDHGRRITAVQIVADLAPTWAISELIELLSDHDPAVRFHAATALRRLTAEDQGRSPERWREPWSDCVDSHSRWKQWQEKNRELYRPPLDVPDSNSPNTRKKKI